MATTPRPLADYFAELRDPRVQLKCVHDFMDIILIVVCATIGGADDFVSVAQFAKAKEEWFRTRLGLQLKNGIPSHDTFNRVFAIIHPTHFQRVPLPRSPSLRCNCRCFGFSRPVTHLFREWLSV